MKYCKYCGAEMLDDAVMCVKCGKMVDGYYANKILKRREEEENTTVINGVVDDDGNIIPMEEPSYSKVNRKMEVNNGDNQEAKASMDLYCKLGFAFSFFIPFLGAGFSVAAIYNRDKTTADGRRMAIAGLVLSLIGFTLAILVKLLVLNKQ